MVTQLPQISRSKFIIELPFRETSFRGVISFTSSISFDCKLFDGDMSTILASVAANTSTIL